MHQLDEQQIDLVLLGYKLGATNGLELVRAWRLKWDCQLPVIVLASQTTPEVKHLIREAGLRFLAKPVSPARLRALMSQLLIAASAD